MIRNIMLRLEYDGSDYFGWQIQSDSPSAKGSKPKTVQGELEEAIKKLFRQKVKLIYAGRTDRGVHAFDQVVNFSVDSSIPLLNIKEALNSFLPEDIKIKSIQKAHDAFHARFSVSSKIYRYRISQQKEPSVFERNYSWFIGEELDLARMRKIAQKLIGNKDRSLFARQPKNYHDCHRMIFKITIQKKKQYIIIDIEASGFLRNMARNIVSFLVAVGQKKLSLREANGILNGNISWRKKPAPACGLYLYKVKYNRKMLPKRQKSL